MFYFDELLCYIDIMQINHLRSEATIDMQSGVNFNRLTAFSVSSNLHDHDFCEFFFISKGEIIHKINGRSELVREGQVVFIRPQDVHSFANSGSACEMYNVAFRNQLLVKCANFAENSISLEAFYGSGKPPELELDLEKKNELIKELELAGEELAIDSLRAKSRFYIIVLRLFSLRFPQRRNAHTKLPSWFEELCSKMKQKNNFIAGLARMQELAYCSPEHLCRCCQNYLGQSPTEFINELRINYAASQLIHSDEKIYSIAMNSGFPNLSHFYHQFKKVYSISPAVFRKRQQSVVV